MHFITNGYNRFLETNSSDSRQRVHLKFPVILKYYVYSNFSEDAREHFVNVLNVFSVNFGKWAANLTTKLLYFARVNATEKGHSSSFHD